MMKGSLTYKPRIVFSVDSMVKETFEAIVRAGAKYDQVVGNIRDFVQMKRDKKYMFPVVKVQMVVMNKKISLR